MAGLEIKLLTTKNRVMKSIVMVVCKEDFKDVYVGQRVAAIYAYSTKHRKMLYHIGSAPVDDNTFKKHFDIIGTVTEN